MARMERLPGSTSLVTQLLNSSQEKVRAKNVKRNSTGLRIALLTAWDGWVALILSACSSSSHSDSKVPFPDRWFGWLWRGIAPQQAVWTWTPTPARPGVTHGESISVLVKPVTESCTPTTIFPGFRAWGRQALLSPFCR